MWRVGDTLRHRHNPGLGPGRVVEAAGDRLVVHFPHTAETLGFVAASPALEKLELGAGSMACLDGSGEEVELAEALTDGAWRLADGRIVWPDELWPVAPPETPLDRLIRGEIDGLEDFRSRLDALRLLEVREADGLGSFLGGRVRLYPHQLWAAESACRTDPVRWLLADGVGLGKTVEACLIMNRLLHSGRAHRVMVVAPEALTVQWLGELWRKYHRIFTLLDDDRLGDARRAQGTDANPFEMWERTVVAMEQLEAQPWLVDRAREVGVDLVVVDEAHRLRRPPGHAGEPAYRVVRALADGIRHAILLTATPLEHDAHGFLRLVQILRPDVFPDEESLTRRLEGGEPLPACVSATRAEDIGGWPPRRAEVIDAEGDWKPLVDLETELRRRPAETAPSRRKKADLIRRASASAAALEPVLDRDDPLQEKVALARATDPRLEWLVAQARRWKADGDKTLVFVAHRETLEWLREELERRAFLRPATFHEDLPAARRDVEVARFRLPEGPSMMVTTECGGEGRNFEFCRRLVLFDLPWEPGVVEQRIGRLDRIGRSRPTEIVAFRPPTGMARSVIGLYQAMGLFDHSVGGLGQELARLATAIEELALDGPIDASGDALLTTLRDASGRRDDADEAAARLLAEDRYRDELAGEILGRVPPDLDQRTETLVLRAAARLGLEVEERRGHRCWYFELGPETLVDGLPGVAADARFLGTFDREHGVEDESLEFFASGHPLIEGILEELADGDRGRATAVALAGAEEAFGLLALARDGSNWTATAVDATGRRRPDLAAALVDPASPLEPAAGGDWARVAAWGDAIRRLARKLPKSPPPVAVTAFRIVPRSG
jgi:ATP-dependent helicase HepA